MAKSQRACQFAMAAKQAGLTRDQVKEIERQEAIDNAATMITAYAINIGVASGLSDKNIEDGLPGLATKALAESPLKYRAQHNHMSF